MSYEPKDFLEACNRSAESSRRPLAILVVSYVIVFCAIWNSRDNCWHNSFIKSAGAAIAWLEAPPAVKENPTAGSRLDLGRTFVHTYGVDDPKLLAWAIDTIRTDQVEKNLFFELPFFNVSVHINDLGVLSGLAFMLLLIWYRQCLAHLLLCTRIALRTHCGADAAATRQLIAMHQFLTIPTPDPTGVRPARATQLLLLVPSALLQTYLLWTNWTTRPLAFALGARYALPILGLTTLFSLIVVVLVSDCHYQLGLIATEWRVDTLASERTPRQDTKVSG